MFLASTSGTPTASQLVGFDKIHKGDSGNPEIRYFNYYLYLNSNLYMI